jgi:hypothetical protein
LNAKHKRYREVRRSAEGDVTWAVKRMISEARARSEEMGWDFNLSLNSLETPNCCPVFGMPLVYSARKKRTDSSASLDRIDSNRGYTTDNVWIISWLANRIKSNATPAQLIQVAVAVRRKMDWRIWDQMPEVKRGK